eukprot:2427037-Pleurochrysis_carterae.AAC.2
MAVPSLPLHSHTHTAFSPDYDLCGPCRARRAGGRTRANGAAVLPHPPMRITFQGCPFSADGTLARPNVRGASLSSCIVSRYFVCRCPFAYAPCVRAQFRTVERLLICVAATVTRSIFDRHNAKQDCLDISWPRTLLCVMHCRPGSRLHSPFLPQRAFMLRRRNVALFSRRLPPTQIDFPDRDINEDVMEKVCRHSSVMSTLRAVLDSLGAMRLGWSCFARSSPWLGPCRLQVMHDNKRGYLPEREGFCPFILAQKASFCR